MACDYCLGDPDGCPICGGKPLVPCPDCEDGYHYYMVDIDKRFPISKEDYDNTPEEYRERVECPTCHGKVWL